MNLVKPRVIAGVVGAVSTAALGGSVAPAVAAAAPPATTIDSPAAEASSAESLQAPEDLTTAGPSFGEVCFPGA